MSTSKNPITRDNPTQQELRKSALHWQLAALDEQLGVLRELDKEHSFGIENTAEVTHLVDELRGLVKSAELIAEEAKTLQQEELASRISAFHQLVKQIKEEVDGFNGGAVQRAKLRLHNFLEGDAPAPASTVETSTPADPDRLFARAISWCYKAESSQYNAFALQINALCDLALEIIYNAAGEALSQAS